MDSFEKIVSELLESEGFWTRTNYKVDLTKAQKRMVGRSTAPRWDLDVIAFKPRKKQLLVVECKSYLDSRGVSFRGFNPETGGTSRFKLFNDEQLRNTVFDRLHYQLFSDGLISDQTTIQLCLATPKIVPKSRSQIEAHFRENNWQLFDLDWIHERLSTISEGGYQNSVVSMLAKILTRDVEVSD